VYFKHVVQNLTQRSPAYTAMARVECFSTTLKLRLFL